MPSAVVFVLSATLPTPVLSEVKASLGLPREIQTIRRSNDRHNIALVVRQMQHSVRSLQDLAFLFPEPNSPNPKRSRKFMVFMESKDLCERATAFLWLRLPRSERHKVVWVHADMSREHNRETLELLRAGEIYGIVCTDVAGMVSILYNLIIIYCLTFVPGY